MFSADHPFQLAGLRVRDEDGNLHCAACGRIRGMHPEEETDEPQAVARHSPNHQPGRRTAPAAGQVTCRCDCRQCHLGYHCSECGTAHWEAVANRGRKLTPPEKRHRYGD